MSNVFLEDMYDYWRLYAKDKVVEMKEKENRKKEMESMTLNDFIKRQYEKAGKDHWYNRCTTSQDLQDKAQNPIKEETHEQMLNKHFIEVRDLRASELATESVPDSPLTLTLPEGTEAFKGQIRASNGVLYKVTVEKIEEM
jgi:hypothetical protein